MAVRLPVILSQPQRRDASTAEQVENLVAAALFIPGLDANLIGDISTLESGSTDHVCLLGHTRDLVLASFLSLEEAQAAWSRLGQGGHFIDLSRGEANIRASLADASPGRKVFYFQLALGQPVDRLLDLCRKLLAAQQSNLVSIQWRPGSGLPGSAGAQAFPVTPPQTRFAQSDSPTSVLLESASDGPTSSGASRGRTELSASEGRSLQTGEAMQLGQASGTHIARAAPVKGDDLEEWSALDKLVDDLDALDL